MKDMFYNYDNNIDKNLQNRPHFPAGYPAVLESDPNISIVKDAKDRENALSAAQLENIRDEILRA